MEFINNFKESFYDNFIKEDRWQYLTDGLKNTLIITILAVLMGMVLGFIIAVIRATHDKTGKMKILNFFAKIYLTVIRGTPVVVQLLIIYFVIFGSVNISKILVAVLAFGLNSGAYVAEIVRSGIMSIDGGQFEAGSSLGLSYRQTMISIILPQAFKNVLPALANEFIVLLKETSVAGYIAIADLTKGGDIIRSQTYEPFLPLIAVALIYLVMVMFLTHLITKLERRLAKNDKR
ncbi:MAG: amino acid ABC transporter permease [Ruminococcus sp.]|nr:amino acid ABC transporter permease [Ruminococcus sp.]